MLDTTAENSDTYGMSYPGGKSGAGVYQKIINLMPPHDTYIEPFLGGAAIMRLKRPARLNIGLDLDAQALGAARCSISTSNGSAGNTTKHDGCRYDFIRADGIRYMQTYRFTGNELVYCDPPYMHETRTRSDLYRFEMTDDQHRALLNTLLILPCMVMLSGYWTALYAEHLKDWNHIQFEAMTRGGRTATEWLWFNFPSPQSTRTVTSCHSSLPASPPVMTSEALADIGTARHGSRWKSPLAREIGVTRETMSRWASGRFPIPQDKALALRGLQQSPSRLLHDDQYVGENYRERERIKRKKQRWVKRLQAMPPLERQALLAAIAEVWPESAASPEMTLSPAADIDYPPIAHTVRTDGACRYRQP